MEEIISNELSEEAELSAVEEEIKEPKLEEAEAATDEVAPSIDYANLVREDVMALRAEFSELSSLTDVTELDNPLRYAALRDLGLSPREAYLATATKQRSRTDNRAHLYSTPPRAVGGASMPEAELSAAREIFGDLSDAEIRKLYKKVTV